MAEELKMTKNMQEANARAYEDLMKHNLTARELLDFLKKATGTPIEDDAAYLKKVGISDPDELMTFMSATDRVDFPDKDDDSHAVRLVESFKCKLVVPTLTPRQRKLYLEEKTRGAAGGGGGGERSPSKRARVD